MSSPTVDSAAVSSPATMNVAELTSDSSVTARCPSRQASVMPPAHMPATLASSVALMSHTISMASLHADT